MDKATEKAVISRAAKWAGMSQRAVRSMQFREDTMVREQCAAREEQLAVLEKLRWGVGKVGSFTVSDWTNLFERMGNAVSRELRVTSDLRKFRRSRPFRRLVRLVEQAREDVENGKPDREHRAAESAREAFRQETHGQLALPVAAESAPLVSSTRSELGTQGTLTL